MFKKLCAMLILAGAGMSAASAGTITGPALPAASGGWYNNGVRLEAKVDATLKSFVFHSADLNDTVVLADMNGAILQSVATRGGLLEVNWALSAGQQYLLLQYVQNNSMYTVVNGPVVKENAEIALVDTGLFGCYTAVYTECGIKGNAYWTAFTDFETGALAGDVPEPASLALLGLGLAGLASSRRRKSH